MYIKYRKVKDHFHYTGKYTGTAHNICNLRYKTPKEVPIDFHNTSTYDYHFIIKELAKDNLNAWEKILKNILLFLCQLKNSLIMVKQLHTN